MNRRGVIPLVVVAVIAAVAAVGGLITLLATKHSAQAALCAEAGATPAAISDITQELAGDSAVWNNGVGLDVLASSAEAVVKCVALALISDAVAKPDAGVMLPHPELIAVRAKAWCLGKGWTVPVAVADGGQK